MSGFDLGGPTRAQGNSFEKDPSSNRKPQPSSEQYDADGSCCGQAQEDGERDVSPPVPNGNTLHEEYDERTKLPPLEATAGGESSILREWKRRRAIELEEKARVAREKHEQIVARARAEQEAFHKKRASQVEEAKARNRQKEDAYAANLEAREEGGNRWEAVVRHIDVDAAAAAPGAKKGGAHARGKEDGPVRASTLLTTLAPGRQTDLTRMRQVLVKSSKSNIPPPSMDTARLQQSMMMGMMMANSRLS